MFLYELISTHQSHHNVMIHLNHPILQYNHNIWAFCQKHEHSWWLMENLKTLFIIHLILRKILFNVRKKYLQTLSLCLHFVEFYIDFIFKYSKGNNHIIRSATVVTEWSPMFYYRSWIKYPKQQPKANIYTVYMKPLTSNMLTYVNHSSTGNTTHRRKRKENI